MKMGFYILHIQVRMFLDKILTRANYNPNGGPSEAPDYRKGSPGTIVYWLS